MKNRHTLEREKQDLNMKTFFLLIAFLPLFASAQTCTTERLVGTWVCGTEEFGVKCLYTWVLTADGKSSWHYECDEGSHGRTSGRWWCDGDKVYESYDGKAIYGTVEWKDEETIQLTIDNNGSKDYTGMVRVYKRIKK